MTTKPKNKDVPSKTEANPAQQVAKKRPVKIISVEDISVPIFAHERTVNEETKVNYSWSPQRSYKDSAGQWKRTPWFGQDDCGKVLDAVQKTHEWIHDQQQSEPAAQ